MGSRADTDVPRVLLHHGRDQADNAARLPRAPALPASVARSAATPPASALVAELEDLPVNGQRRGQLNLLTAAPIGRRVAAHQR